MAYYIIITTLTVMLSHVEIFRGAEISCRITTCSQDSPDSKWCQEHWQKMLHENCEKLRAGILRGTNRSDSHVTMIHANWSNKAGPFLYAFKISFTVSFGKSSCSLDFCCYFLWGYRIQIKNDKDSWETEFLHLPGLPSSRWTATPWGLGWKDFRLRNFRNFQTQFTDQMFSEFTD